MAGGDPARACYDARMSRVALAHLAVAVLALASLIGCDPTATTGCTETCASRAPACDTCPALADEVCVDDACVALDARDARVSADVSIARDLDGVVAVVIAVVDARGADCASLPPLTEAAGVLAGTRVDVSGGPFHPDLAFGEVPGGAVLVAGDGLDRDGAVVGRGCLPFDAVAGDNDAGILAVDAL